MKGKILTAGLAMVAAVCFCLGLAACGDGGCEHEYTADNVCALCGKEWNYTEGLNYVYDETTDTYSVGKNAYVSGNVAIPYGYQGKFVTKIGESAFDSCGDLTAIAVPGSVTEIGKDAFWGCAGLREVYITDLAAWCKIDFESSSMNPVSYAHHLLLNGKEVTALTIPKGITEIKDYTFYDCDGLTSVTIPDSVTEIGDYAFGYCDGLTGVTIGRGVTSVGEWALEGCNNLESITADKRNQTYSSQGGVLYNKEKTEIVLVPKGINGTVKIEGGVTEIGEYAFWGCTALTGIEIPDSVTSIGSGAFYKCTALTSVTIPDSVTSIGWGAFESCDELTAVTIGRGVTEIEGAAFGGCYKLIEVWNHSGLDIQKGESWYDVAYYAKYVYTGDEVSKQTATDDGYLFFEDGTEVYLLGYRGTETALTLPAKSPSGKEYAIYQYAFYMRTELTGVTIGNGVTAIGERAFYDCRGLTGVTIESGVTEIGESAFAFCIGLTGIEIPDSVVSIGEYAFIGCLGLTRVTIGNGVTEIGGQAFASTELTDIQFKGTVAEWQEVQKGSWWDSSIGDYTVTCTDGTVDKEGNVTDF